MNTKLKLVLAIFALLICIVGILFTEGSRKPNTNPNNCTYNIRIVDTRGRDTVYYQEIDAPCDAWTNQDTLTIIVN